MALVSGASKGIGRAIARGLAAEGAQLSICARTESLLRAAAGEIEEKYQVACLSCVADLSQAEGIQGWVRATVERFGGIDILVNNAD